MSKWNEVYNKMDKAVTEHSVLSQAIVDMIWADDQDQQSIKKVEEQLEVVEEEIDYYNAVLNELN